MGTDDARTVVNSILGAYGLPQLKATKGFKYFDDFEVRFFGLATVAGSMSGSHALGPTCDARCHAGQNVQGQLWTLRPLTLSPVF